ncbi:hypothetical protein H5410_058660 [Solanum commersonii]|uniref:Uncharacterized protein n=1 Tax=Solanum commersonii TaxID=4109 RepID=A0A9J5WU98_SOLCO|nr:hypothetical protein H5410_058660 [Solanum commersonii]
MSRQQLETPSATMGGVWRLQCYKISKRKNRRTIIRPRNDRVYRPINEMELFDPPLFGGSYTGEGVRTTHNASESTDSSTLIIGKICSRKLDKVCSRVGSDHSPIALNRWKAKSQEDLFQVRAMVDDGSGSRKVIECGILHQ